jgi:5-methyltetrahydropteroyltriglutamate--homocysteine methyltransferase
MEAREAFTAGRINAEQLRQAEDAAILRALDLQKRSGIGIYTDGEYRRSWFAGGFADAVEGLVPDPAGPTYATAWQGPNREAAIAQMKEFSGAGMVAGAKLRLKRRIAGDEAAFLKQHAPGPWKMTMTPPGFAGGPFFREGVTDKFYSSPDEMMNDVIAMYQDEVRNLVNDGAAYIQLDSLAYASSAPAREALVAQGLDPQVELDKRIAIDNAVLSGADRSKVTLGLHICRGNNSGSWLTAGDYEFAAEKAFNQLNVDRFLLEYDTERSGGFEPLRHMPRNKTALLGLISTKTPQLESQDDLLRRIDEASKYIPVENLAIGPQCGFASGFRGNPISWDDQLRKLELVVETAKKVWG